MRVLAIDIGGTAVKLGMMEGETLTPIGERPTRAQEGANVMLSQIVALAGELAPFDAVGVSTASQVDPHTGVITSATDTFPGYTGVPVKELLQERLGVSAAVDNDVNCAALAEGTLGAGRDFADFVCLAYGTGIGGAVILGHQLYYGARWSAGEVGHMKTHVGGRLCNCGMRGCYEQYASTHALTSQAGAAYGRAVSGRELCALRRQGDPLAQDLIDQWVGEVVGGLSSVVHMLNPPCVVLGGGIMEDDFIFSEVVRRFPGQVMPNFRETAIRRAELGNAAGMWGAALLAARLI